MPKIKLTEARARDLPPGDYQDTEEPSLRLYVSETSRTWGLYKWSPVERRPVRKAIGPLRLVSVDEARKRARTLGLRLLDGESVHREDTLTVEQLVRRYVEWNRARRLRHPAAAEDFLRLGFNEWRARDAATVTRQDVSARYLALATERGPAAAGKYIKALSSWYEWAVRHELLTTNPVKGVRVAGAAPRSRYLSRAEATKLDATLDEPQTPEWVRDFVRLLLEVGCRWGNLVTARWEHFDLDAGTWRVPASASKNATEMALPLSARAVTLLRERRERVKSEWVFPTNRKSATGHITDPQRAWETVAARAGIEGATLHDLRRTRGVRLVEAGAPITVVAKVLGHRDPAVTARVYAHATPDAVKDWLNR